ncbi:MAG: tetratricopeptide repeat protein [Undibacterium sp.]|nr:tetratricopeptide repeat protein [Opitutaceae bacterium]
MSSFASAPSSPERAPIRLWMRGALLVIVVFLAYLAVLPGGFIWDDDQHITANPAIIGPQGLREIWTTAAANYFPLVLTNFWVQHALWGLHPLGYHLVTLACHALAAVLLWRVLSRLSVRGAWLGAALWALHPVQVESVAWICELKNTQSAVFFLLAIRFYLKWLEVGRVFSPPSALESPAQGGLKTRPTANPSAYILALGCALLAILSKPSTVTLPVALALCVWWQRGRLTWRDFLPLAPFFALALSAAGWTIWEQRVHSGAEGAAWAQTWPERFVIAGRAVWFYAGKLAWPADLIFIYPRWQVAATPVALAPFAAVLAVVALLWRRRQGALRPVFFAAVYFGALLFPVLGFFSIYFFRYSFVGDHFQYLASMGPLALAGAGITVALRHLPAGAARLRLVVPALLLVALGGMTWRESREYLSHESLWRATLARNPAASMAWFNLGDTLVKQGRHEEAIACFRRGVELRPDDAPGYNDLACELVVVGRPQEALAVFARALAIRPGYAEVHNNLGNALRSLGRIEAAITQYEQALRFKPDYAEAHNNLGCELGAKGRSADAIAHLEAAVRLNPANATNHSNLGNALRDAGRGPEALASYERALKSKPDFAEAHDNYGLALLSAGRGSEALARFAEAARFGADSPKIRRDYGKALAQQGRFPEAVAEFEAVVRLDPGAVAAHTLLGAALVQTDRWPEALACFEAGLKIAPDDADLHCNRAVALATVGRTQEAVAAFNEALRLRPALIDAHSNLAQVLRQLGRNLDAADHFDEAERLRAERARRP